jgi:hypothetical protein
MSSLERAMDAAFREAFKHPIAWSGHHGVKGAESIFIKKFNEVYYEEKI